MNTYRSEYEPVCSVSYRPNGQQLAGGCFDTVRVWDAESGAEVAVLRGHESHSFVHSVSYSPDGGRIVSGSSDGTVRMWDAHGGAKLAVLRVLKQKKIIRSYALWSFAEDWKQLSHGIVFSVSYSPDGRRIASGSGDGIVRIWKTCTRAELVMLRLITIVSAAFPRLGDKNWAILTVLRGHEGCVRSVSYSPDAQRIASGSEDGSVRVWDAESGVELAILQGHDMSVLSSTYSPDGQLIASGSLDRTVRVWDAHTGAELAVLHGHEAGVTCVSFRADGQRIASGSGDGSVRIWDTQSWAELAVFRTPLFRGGS